MTILHRIALALGALALAATGAWGQGSTQPTRVTPTAQTSASASTDTCFREATVSSNAVSCKATAGNVYAIRAFNDTSTLYYLKLYDTAGAPTCSSATGFKESLTIPHNMGTGNGFSVSLAVPKGYANGIGLCITGGPGPTDNTNAAVGVRVSIDYK